MAIDNDVRALETFLKSQLIDGKTMEDFIYNETNSKSETLTSLKTFSTWFRDQFPYFYDQCECCLNRENNSYLGTIFPNVTERNFLAGRTELYLCGLCNNVSRFPRYNNVAKVTCSQN